MSKGPWKYPSKARLARYLDAAREKGAELVVSEGQIRFSFPKGEPSERGANEWDRAEQ
jgi:hypothetical protein